VLGAHPNELVVIKFFAAYCQACKALEPKFIAVKEDRQLEGLPIVWAEYQAQRSNKDLFQRLGVLTLPTVHFYDGSRGLVENFPCGPAKVPLLKKKLARFLNTRVDPETLQLKELIETERDRSLEPRVTREASDSEFITSEHIEYLRNGLPFFRDLTDEEFDDMLAKAKLLTFNPGDTIIRQGMPPTTFYVLKSGVAEMGVRSKFDDPISTPSNYIGAVVNELKTFDYFGERALTTGEPYAATVRVLEKVRCFAFDVDDIPESSILSKKRRATQEMVEQLNRRYELPVDYTPEYPVTPRDECILELLVRFKQIRQAAKCFEYVMQSEPKWGDEGEIARRTMLVNKLSKTQRDEFQEVFDIVDVEKRGRISLREMRKFMESARAEKSSEELLGMIARANPLFNVNLDYAISRDEFMGVMAEAEFYNLFTETFQELDRDNTGYVRAGDLDDVLGGVRDLIGEERTSIIDVEDKDMLVNYEQFSRMLLGAAL
jgi:Ca2+-binding EF-hand superfamily protein